MISNALISPCDKYRYWLTRVWNDRLPMVAYVMLNPSTADHNTDDPTIRRCLGFATLHGFGGIRVVNLFAYRATDPLDLKAAGFPVGPENDQHIRYALANCQAAIAAWGATTVFNRISEVKGVMESVGRPVQCLGRTKGGQPRHPLMLLGNTPLEPYFTPTPTEPTDGHVESTDRPLPGGGLRPRLRGGVPGASDGQLPATG